MSNLLAEFVDVPQFAADVRKDPRMVYRWMERNGLPFAQVGGTRLILLPSARLWIMRQMKDLNPERRSRRRNRLADKRGAAP
jgi:hypothetical protein